MGDDVKKLIITRGLPASGKTTKAEAWVAKDPVNRVRVNRDDIRQMLHNGVFVQRDELTRGTEDTVIKMRDALISTALSAGRDVICDDTNLPQRVACDLRRLADKHSAEFEVWDLTDVDMGTCITRDYDRGVRGGRTVGPKVISDMHTRFLRGRRYPLPFPEPTTPTALDVVPYVGNPGGQSTYLVDIDGTIALMGDRSPYDETRVGADRPNVDVIRVVRALHLAGYRIIFMSARTEGCYDATRAWLNRYVDITGVLIMRAVGDTRKDAIVKLELFDRHIRNNLDVNVVGVFDDRKQVVDMWRALGLTVFAVAEGNF
jgi:predicted kinase